MFLWLTHFSTTLSYVGAFRVFQYITFRSILSALTALILALVLGPWMIRKLKSYQLGQVVRDDGPQTHLTKAGTPTMGGILILVTMAVSVLLWGDLANLYVWTALFGTLSFGVLGWMDDYFKIHRKSSKGLPARWKYFWQSVLGLVIALLLYFHAKTPVETSLLHPIF